MNQLPFLIRLVAATITARQNQFLMAECAHQRTEIAYLQGEVVELGERIGRAAPVNRTLVRLIREAEGGGKRDFTGPELAGVLDL